MILFVGRFSFEKNLLNLIDAFKTLSKIRSDMQLVMVGDGELKNKMCKLTEDYQDILILPYFGDKDELMQMYSTADVFVHPGVLETFGFVMIEAQSCGTKVVSVKDSIVHESCRHDEDNIAAEDEFSDAIAEAIDKSLKIHTSWEKRLWRHQQMVERFSNNTTYSRMTKLYHDVIS
jgi:alpha-1,6-mannosyltransferase